MSPAEREGLRAMVRDAIREALAARGGAAAGAGAATVEPVRIASDVDLADFVKRLAALLRDPAEAARIEAGSHRFTLGGTGPAESFGATAPLAGLVNERAVEAAPEGALLRLAPDAVVTPLARDRARQRRIKLERVR